MKAGVRLLYSVSLLLGSLVRAQDFINRMALMSFQQAGQVNFSFIPCAPVSIYTVMYNIDEERSDFNASSTSRTRQGRISSELSVYHPFGYRLSYSREWLAEYPMNYNMYSYLNARTELPISYNFPLRLTINNEDAHEDGMVVIVQNDDFANDKRGAYPFLIGPDPKEFMEMYAFLDYGGDEDYFLIGIHDPNNTLNGVPQLMNFWSETALLNTGKVTDVYAYLYDKDGNQLAYHDDIQLGVLQNFDFQYTLVPNTPYYMRIKGWAQNTVGSYIFRYSRLARTQTDQLLLTKATNVTFATNVTANGTVQEIMTTVSTTVPFTAPVVTVLVESGNMTNTTTAAARNTPFASIFDQVTFSCPGGCPTLAGVATVQQWCAPHRLCTGGHRPAYTTACADQCTADPASVSTSTIVCPTPPPPPPPPPPPSNPPPRPPRPRRTVVTTSASVVETVVYNSRIRRISRAPVQQSNQNTDGIAGPFSVVIYAAIGILGALFLGVIIYFALFRGKSDEDFADPYADSSSVYSAGTRDTRQTGRSSAKQSVSSGQPSSRNTQNSRKDFANNPHASYGASSYSAYSNIDN